MEGIILTMCLGDDFVFISCVVSCGWFLIWKVTLWCMFHPCLCYCQESSRASCCFVLKLGAGSNQLVLTSQETFVASAARRHLTALCCVRQKTGRHTDTFASPLIRNLQSKPGHHWVPLTVRLWWFTNAKTGQFVVQRQKSSIIM